MKEVPETITTILECPRPTPKPTSPVFPSFGLFAPNEISIVVNMQDFAWLLARNFSSQQQANDEVPLRERNEDLQEERGPCFKTIPVWSAFNSLISSPMDVTKVGMPPLLPSPAHEWPTMLTILMQAQNISTSIVGPGRKTVISLDMGLYHKKKKASDGKK